MFKVIIAGVVLTIVAVFVFSKIDPKVKKAQETTTQDKADFLSITVTGQVAKPGTYVMKNGDTIDTLLISAGGPTENADANAYYETTVLTKGVSYYIAPLFDESDICGTTEIAKVNLNTDSRDALMAVNGLGSTIATAIVNHRETNGSFTYLEEVKKVSGIGNATFEKIKNYIVLR